MKTYLITNKKTKESVKAYLGTCDRWEEGREYYIFEHEAFNRFIAFHVDVSHPNYRIEELKEQAG